mmetsp:Transcript_10066/g.16620  ORF Transcript_10066/g.16620 Transcript_10066/m.16620 type:complete len:285 (+) Transcript_10066:216-1070(+)
MMKHSSSLSPRHPSLNLHPTHHYRLHHSPLHHLNHLHLTHCHHRHLVICHRYHHYRRHREIPFCPSSQIPMHSMVGPSHATLNHTDFHLSIHHHHLKHHRRHPLNYTLPRPYHCLPYPYSKSHNTPLPHPHPPPSWHNHPLPSPSSSSSSHHPSTLVPATLVSDVSAYVSAAVMSPYIPQYVDHDMPWLELVQLPRTDRRVPRLVVGQIRRDIPRRICGGCDGIDCVVWWVCNLVRRCCCCCCSLQLWRWQLYQLIWKRRLWHFCQSEHYPPPKNQSFVEDRYP